jgi:hypothetical protein
MTFFIGKICNLADKHITGISCENPTASTLGTALSKALETTGTGVFVLMTHLCL